MEVLIWEKEGLKILDQTGLPQRVEYILCRNHEEVAEAIRRLRVRGAPAIGIAAAFGYALAAFNFGTEKNKENKEMEEYLSRAASVLRETRPTAVNLAWALERMEKRYHQIKDLPVDEIQDGLLAEAMEIYKEELRCDERIGSFGFDLIPERARILTYCNTGALATAGLGTALGVILMAGRRGKEVHVYVSETRPVLQGARLTAWELFQAGIPYTLITDNMAGYLFSRGMIDLVIVGADRVVANGDFANKIGTYGLAVLAAYHSCPFYVAAPISTFDTSLATGREIPVEMRDPDEVRCIGGVYLAPVESPVMNPSFDITPHELVSAFITDRGIIRPPFDDLVERIS